MNCPEQAQAREWIKDIDRNALDFWREAMAQLRQLHSDVWNGVRFFLTVNGIMIAAMVTLAKSTLEASDNDSTLARELIIVLLCVMGYFLTKVGRSILVGHRTYYLRMLMRKTLLEINLGFWNTTLQNTPLAFPWYVERQYHQELLDNPEEWLKRTMFGPETITKWLGHTYHWVSLVYIIAFISTVLWILISVIR